jgi:transposase
VAGLGLCRSRRPAIATDPQLRDQYERLKPHGTNKAKTAMARKLLTITFQLLRDRRPYERRGASMEESASTKSRLS